MQQNSARAQPSEQVGPLERAIDHRLVLIHPARLLHELDEDRLQVLKEPAADRIVAGRGVEQEPRVGQDVTGPLSGEGVQQRVLGRHRDHRVAAELVRDACFLAGLKKLEVEGDPFRPLKLVYATAFREDVDLPSFVVDISQQLRKKLEALSCFSSQFEGVRGYGEVYPGGERDILEQVRMKMGHYGSLIRVEYGEPFRVGEPFDVADLSQLTVATF